MASEAQRYAVTSSGCHAEYSSRSTSASSKWTLLSLATTASRRASAMAGASRSRPTTCFPREASDTLLGLEVLGLGVMEDEGRHGGLGIHHESIGQPHSDLFRAEQVEEDVLVGEVRTR